MGQNLTGQSIASTYEDLVQISGSILTNGLGTDITSLTVTASFASQAGTSGYAGTAGTAAFATSASFATTASFALNATPTNTGSLMVTGSALSNVLTFTKGDGSQFSLTVATGSGGGTVDTGSLLTTASFSDPNLTFTKGDGSTFAVGLTTLVPLTSSYALQAGTAGFASQAGTSGFATQAGTSGFATSASFASQAGTAGFATTATSASFASQAGTAGVSVSASFATTASFALTAATASYLETGFYASASFSGSTWTFNHNLNESYVIIECYDANNEEIIPQTIDLVSVNQAVITFPVIVEGVALASLGNGIVPAIDPNSSYSLIQSQATSVNRQKLNITSAITYNIHVSQSGIHWADATGLASGTSANLNIYVYPELLPTNDVAGMLFSYNSGSAAAINYRTIVSASAGYAYYNSGLNIGNSSTALTRQTNNSVRHFGIANTNPTIFTKAADGTFYGSVSALPIPALTYYFTGTQGTPIP